ncbi:hypothetical protein LCGC14_0589170 [marine sediment metagenome]|uniref:Uncharacterized protein n=1 Tax=marine sediment metagenome TaxID=412755 RepID=A0A0F9RE51_9ZZZZ
MAELKFLMRFDGWRSTFILSALNILMIFFILKSQFIIGFFLAFLVFMFFEEKFVMPKTRAILEKAYTDGFTEGHLSNLRR